MIHYSMFCVLSYVIREISDYICLKLNVPKPFLGLDSQKAKYQNKLGLIPVVRFEMFIQQIIFSKSGELVYYRVDQS